ncbi:MAG: hypothetical protein KF685_12890, partial [Acidobacteria bacterium]|nr:hypothetical protein [Acidobacteriota bacterium]
MKLNHSKLRLFRLYNLRLFTLAGLSVVLLLSVVTFVIAQTQTRNIHGSRQAFEITTSTENDKKTFKVGETLALSLTIRNIG